VGGSCLGPLPIHIHTHMHICTCNCNLAGCMQVLLHYENPIEPFSWSAAPLFPPHRLIHPGAPSSGSLRCTLISHKSCFSGTYCSLQFRLLPRQNMVKARVNNTNTALPSYILTYLVTLVLPALYKNVHFLFFSLFFKSILVNIIWFILFLCNFLYQINKIQSF
jgi:hypothetical protein